MRHNLKPFGDRPAHSREQIFFRKDWHRKQAVLSLVSSHSALSKYQSYCLTCKSCCFQYGSLHGYRSPGLQMTFKTPIKLDLYSRTFVRFGKQRVEKVSRKSTTVNWVYVIILLHPLYAHCDHQLPNLCSMEINEIRPFFVRAMGVLTQITRDPAADSRQFGV